MDWYRVKGRTESGWHIPLLAGANYVFLSAGATLKKVYCTFALLLVHPGCQSSLSINMTLLPVLVRSPRSADNLALRVSGTLRCRYCKILCTTFACCGVYTGWWLHHTVVACIPYGASYGARYKRSTVPCYQALIRYALL